MTQVPPSVSHEIAQESDDWEGVCELVIESGERSGEMCGEELPCRWHD